MRKLCLLVARISRYVCIMKRTCMTLTALVILSACASTEQPARVQYGQPEQVEPQPVYHSPSPKPRTYGQLRKQDYPSLKPESHGQQEEGAPGDETRGEKIRDAGGAIANAASSPLKDLNIIQPKAPKTLANLGYIYQMSTRPTCAQIARELYVLDNALQEPDADEEVIAQSRSEERKELASETTLDAISDTASSIIPFSGVVKTATGARAAEKRYNKQFDDGRRRRAFLRGYALGIGCPAPISPRTLSAPTRLPPNVTRGKDSYTPDRRH